MWNKNRVVKQEKLHNETKDKVALARLVNDEVVGRPFLGTRQDVKKVTGKLPVTGEELSDE